MIVNLKTIEIRSITLKRRPLLGCTKIDSWRAAIAPMAAVVLVFGRRQRGPVRTLNWPASKKRQGTKSREVGHRLSSGRYEDLMAAPLSMVSATRARGDVQCQHTGEPKIVQWTSRQAREVQQWPASELIDGYRFGRRQPGRTLPQLPRFGMSVAQEYF
jgi:hypothetical protein